MIFLHSTIQQAGHWLKLRYVTIAMGGNLLNTKCIVRTCTDRYSTEITSIKPVTNDYTNTTRWGVLPSRCVLTNLTAKIWESSHSSTKSSRLILRTALYVLKLKIEYFQSSLAILNINVQSLLEIALK